MGNRVTIILLALAVFSGCQHAKVNRVEQQYKASSAELYLSLATDQYARADYESAAESAEIAVEAQPLLPKPHVVYGKALLAMGRRHDADSQFATALELDSSLDEAWYGRGLIADESGDRPAACAYVEQAVKCNQSNTTAVIHLAEIYIASAREDDALALLRRTALGNPAITRAAASICLRLGRTDEAVSLYEDLCRARPDDSGSLEALGYAYIDAGRDKDAAELLVMLAEKDSHAVGIHVPVAAACYMRTGDYSKAVRLCDKYASACKNDPFFWITMGRAAIAAHDSTRALYAARRAVSLSPEDAQARTLLGCSFYMAERYTDAIDAFNRLANKEDPFVWAMKGRCFDKLGDSQQAQLAVEHALALDPNNQMARNLAKEFSANTGNR